MLCGDDVEHHPTETLGHVTVSYIAGRVQVVSVICVITLTDTVPANMTINVTITITVTVPVYLFLYIFIYK